MQWTYLTPFIISNRQMCVEKMPFVNSTLFFRFCLPWFETKKIESPKYAFTHRNLPESEKFIWIIQNVHEKSRFFYISITRQFNGVSCNQTLGCLRLYGNSRVSPAQPRINAYEILLQDDCGWLWMIVFFLDIIGSQKRIATYNFHIIKPSAFWRPVISKGYWTHFVSKIHECVNELNN